MLILVPLILTMYDRAAGTLQMALEYIAHLQ